MKDATPATLASISAVLAAALLGASRGPQNPRSAIWYAALRKPRTTPSGKVIAGVWIGLESLLCLSGSRLMQARPDATRNRALAGWWGTLAGLALFPEFFFGERRLGASTAAAAGMLAAATTCTTQAAKTDRVACVAMTPVVVWLGLATLLSADLWRRN